MSSQLAQFTAKHGNTIQLRHRKFEVQGISEDGDTAVATFKAVRASYPGVVCLNTKVAGLPGAEVWSVIGGKREIASFAIHDGQVKDIT